MTGRQHPQRPEGMKHTENVGRCCNRKSPNRVEGDRLNQTVGDREMFGTSDRGVDSLPEQMCSSRWLVTSGL